MGLKEILRIREYVDFDAMGRVVKKYEITFTTAKAPGEFTLDVKAEEYTPEMARKLASEKAEKIDKAIG